MGTADDIAALRRENSELNETLVTLRIEVAEDRSETAHLRKDLDRFQANVQWLWRTLIFAGTPGLVSVIYMALTTKGVI